MQVRQRKENHFFNQSQSIAGNSTFQRKRLLIKIGKKSFFQDYTLGRQSLTTTPAIPWWIQKAGITATGLEWGWGGLALGKGRVSLSESQPCKKKKWWRQGLNPVQTPFHSIQKVSAFSLALCLHLPWWTPLGNSSSSWEGKLEFSLAPPKRDHHYFINNKSATFGPLDQNRSINTPLQLLPNY